MFDDTEYTGLPMEDFVITIPMSMDLFTCDAASFTIWSRANNSFFTRISIDGELFVRKSENYIT